MTILSDLYRSPRNRGRTKRKVLRFPAGGGLNLAERNSPRPGPAGPDDKGPTQQGGVDDQTLSVRPDSEAARRKMEALSFEVPFIANWIDAVFLHYEVDPEALANAVPFPLDTHKEKAYISLVAFTMGAMRPKRGGNATRWLTAPIATHQFLNLRTYVRHQGQYGIFFMKEWLNQSLAVKLGPVTFGLPYHRAEIRYEHNEDEVCGTVTDGDRLLQYGARPIGTPAAAKMDTLDAFLLERYTAFTNAARRPKFFRVWHEPWKVQPLALLEIAHDDLIKNEDHPWSNTARLMSGHFTRGVEGVWMGRPHAVH